MYSLKNLTDASLIDLIGENNESATAELLNRYKNKFYTAAILLVKDRYLAEDLFQNTCIKAITSIREGKYVHDGRFVAWAMRIMRNLALDHIRRSKLNVRVTLPDGADIFSILDLKIDNQEDKISKRESHSKVRKMLEFLNEDQREVIVLRLYGDLSFKEIAALTNSSMNTTLGRMRYGLINLRKIAEEKQIVL